MGTRKDPKTGKYRPLPYYLKIKESDIEGHGLFTTVRLKSGKYIGTTHYNLQGPIWTGLIRTPLGGFINHSENPNCILDKSQHWCYELYVLKHIKSGEELTLKYELYEVSDKDLE